MPDRPGECPQCLAAEEDYLRRREYESIAKYELMVAFEHAVGLQYVDSIMAAWRQELGLH